MEIKTFHGFEDFCVEKFENTDEWYYGMEENAIEFLAPKRKIYLEENESIEFVENEKMYSSKWNEDLLDVLNYGYGEEVIVRDLETGKILERYKGYLNRMPDGTAWLMTE